MKIRFLVLIALMLFMIFAISEDTNEVSTNPDFISEVIKYLGMVIAVFILGRVSWAFGYLAIKFPAMAKYFLMLKQEIDSIIDSIEQVRKTLPKELTAKQGIELRNQATSKIMNTKPANELRRGIANIFGIFGGRSKEFGKELFDNAVPGLIDKQVSKIKSKL